MVSTGNERSFTRLPAELLTVVASHLINRDIKSLRLVNRSCKKLFPLHISRVFLSANSLNINVLKSIADHDTFRHGVKEIVWDDARLKYTRYVPGDGFYQEFEDKELDTVITDNGCPLWFKIERQKSFQPFYDVDLDDELPGHIMTLEESWSYYKKLIEDQHMVLTSAADVEALKYGLARFPSLRRITLTPTAHGPFIGKPLYATPMLRDFPKNLGYPLPMNWPGMEWDDSPIDVYEWNGDEHRGFYGSRCTIEDYRNKWRGFRVILRALAETEHRITEFAMATHHHRTGISCTIFDQPCQETDDLATLLSTPGFRHLDLALFTGIEEHSGFPCFRNGHLQKVLAAAPELEHFSLSCTMDVDENGRPGQVQITDWTDEDMIPFNSILPVPLWPRLRYFGINRLPVEKHDIVALLKSMPDSLRFVRLSKLIFMEDESSYQNLLGDMRDQLNWGTRPEGQRPKVTIVIKRDYVEFLGHYLCADKSVDEFLYSGPETCTNLNPFGDDPMSNDFVEDRGAVEKNYIDPSIYKPYREYDNNEIQETDLFPQC